MNFSEVQRAQLAKSTLLTSAAFQMLKREWGAESNGKLPHLFIPNKTATWVLEFAVEDLPLDRTLDDDDYSCILQDVGLFAYDMIDRICYVF